jgi:hypothetical protein
MPYAHRRTTNNTDGGRGEESRDPVLILFSTARGVPLIMYDGFWLTLDVGGEFGFHTRNPANSRSKRAGFLHSPPTPLLVKQIAGILLVGREASGSGTDLVRLACSFDRYVLSKDFF